MAKDECTISSLAHLLGKTVDEIAKECGKRILHMEEVIDYCMKEGYPLCAVSAHPTTRDREGNRFAVYDTEAAGKRIWNYMKHRQGLCYCATDRGTFHVVAWTGDSYFDPGMGGSIKGFPPNLMVFYMLVTKVPA